jgi:hypothetical protein
MSTRLFGLAGIASIALLAGGIGQASAVTTTTCSSEYTASNGGTTIGGATNIGTVVAGCEIGPYFSNTTGVGTNLGNTPASVSDSVNPSIYEFTWGGGNLTILETLGNNGIHNNINIELGLSTDTLNGNNTLSLDISSVSIPFQSGAGPTTTGTYVLNNYDLAAGTYVLDTYLGSCGAGQSCSDNDTSTDPTYAVGFSPVATPLPATLPLFAGGLGLMGLLGRRRKRKAAVAIAAA